MKNKYLFDYRDFILASIVFIVGMSLYIRTLAPGLLYGDSAEFQTLAYTFGISHPNGYPIFVLLMRLFTGLLPIGDLAWRVNLFSAVCGSLTAVFVYLIVKLLVGSRFGAVAGSLVLIINPIFWWNSILIEVYVPSAMFITLVILLTLVWEQTSSPMYLAFAGLIGGLGLGLHGTVPVIAPAVLVFLAFRVHTKKAWGAAFIGVLIGVILVFLIFLIIDSVNAPASYYNATVRHALSVWAMTPADFDTFLKRFEFVYFANQFNGPFFGFDGIRSDIKHYLQALLRDFSLLTILSMVIGGLYMLRRNIVHAIYLTLAFFCELAVALTIGVTEVVVFYVPGYAILAIFAGLGVAYLISAVHLLLEKPLKGNTQMITVLSSLVGIALILGLVFPYIDNIGLAWRNRTVSFLAGTPYSQFPLPIDVPGAPQREASLLVDNLEDNSVVFTNWIRLFSYYFVAHVEQGRTNMRFHELYPSGKMDGIAESTIDYIKRDFGKYKFYFEYAPGKDITDLFEIDLVNRGKPMYLITGIK